MKLGLERVRRGARPAPVVPGYRLRHVPRPVSVRGGRGGGVGFYIKHGIRVNGVKTQGENIADNGGLRAAWHAFQFTKRAPADSRVSLPGLTGYKPDQLFFLGFAQIWCANSTEPALETQIKKHVHSPNKIRVKGTLSNSKEFADAWSCPAGSPMNPEHKCVLW